MFHDEDKAREALEAELWPEGPICRHCGNSDPEKIARVEGKKRTHRPGLYYCNECKGQFTVTVGTVLERSKVPLTKWLMAAHMFNSGKNGVSAHEIHRTLSVSYKTAWFMMHRLREGMNEVNPPVMGGPGKVIQADETYYGNTSKRAKGYRKGHSHKAGVVALVEPKGQARVFHVKPDTAELCEKSSSPTRAASQNYILTKASFTPRSVTNLPRIRPWNMALWVTDFLLAKTARQQTPPNAAENFFGNFKRSMKGTYRFCSEQHLQRYLNEFQFGTIIVPNSVSLTGNGRRLLLRVSRVSA